MSVIFLVGVEGLDISNEVMWFVPPTRMEEKAHKQKKHTQKHSGPKAQKKKLKTQAGAADDDERKRNPKAFAVQSAVRMAKTFHRSAQTALTSHS